MFLMSVQKNDSGMATSREEVLDLVQDLVGLYLPNLHICVTSRPEIDIRITIDPLTTHGISLHDQSGKKKDIADYISSVVIRTRGCPSGMRRIGGLLSGYSPKGSTACTCAAFRAMIDSHVVT
jgi:hypothetical protein